MPGIVWYDNDKKALCIKNAEGEVSEAHLRPKEYGIWELLSRHSNEAVSRQQMCDEVWGGRYVTDFTINQTINQLRKKIGLMGKDVIITIPRKGYAINTRHICESSYSDSASSDSASNYPLHHENHTNSGPISLGENRQPKSAPLIKMRANCNEHSGAPPSPSKHEVMSDPTKRKKVKFTRMVRRFCQSLFKS